MSDYARAGTIATCTRTVEVSPTAHCEHCSGDCCRLQAGPIDGWAGSMEPPLRKLGLPTVLKNGELCTHTQHRSSLLKFVAGVIVVEKSHNLCVEGTVITPEQAKLLVSLEACNQLCSLPLCDTEIVRNEDCDI